MTRLDRELEDDIASHTLKYAAAERVRAQLAPDDGEHGLVEKRQADFEARNSGGDTVLHRAVETGS